MKLVTPMNSSHYGELEQELELQKKRFEAAARRGLDALKRDLSVQNWIRDYPVPITIGVAAICFALGRRSRTGA
ncbi:MAG: hypothetical protein ACXWP5_08505 [Bdellovibrionota bacterium]